MKNEQKLFILDIWKDIKCSGIKVADEVAQFIGCQSALESNYGKSNIAQTQHNYFGMKTPKKRVTTSHTSFDNQTNHIYASYYSRKESVIDLLLWATTFGKQINLIEINEYKKLLKERGYSEDKEYTNKIDKIYQDFNSNY